MGTTDILSNYSLIVERIVNRSDLTEDTVKQRIGAKIQEYGGLLTEAGAAYSLAKELNVSLADDDYKAQALVKKRGSRRSTSCRKACMALALLRASTPNMKPAILTATAGRGT